MQPRNAANDSAIGAEEDKALSRCLVDARLGANVLEEYPGPLPTTIAQAYSVQAACIEAWPDDVVGWKVARLPVDDRDRFGQERLAGPIFQSMSQTVRHESETVARVFDGGFAAIEAEVILELGPGVEPDIHYDSNDELVRLVSKAYCGAEIASSPMPFVIDLGAMSIISDMGINVGAIVGPEITDFFSQPKDTLTVSTSVDGNVVGEASPAAVKATPIEALRFLIEHCKAHGIALPEGTLVSTGMLTGVHDVRVGSKARVDFGKFGWFDVAFEPITR